MIGKRVVDIRDVTLDEVREILEKGEDELGFEQVKTLDYVKKLTKISKEKANEMIDELMAAVPKVNKPKATKLANLMPKKAGEIEVVFAKEIVSLTEEDIKTILEVVGKYAKK